MNLLCDTEPEVTSLSHLSGFIVQASAYVHLVLSCLFVLSLESKSTVVLVADGLAYSALLKNELLGAGIEKIQDPQTEDRRLQPSTPETRSLFTV